MTSDSQTIKHIQQENMRLKGENTTMRDYVARLQHAVSAMTAIQDQLGKITIQTDVFQMIHRILTSACDAVNSENGSLLLLDDESGELVFVEVIGGARDKLLNYRLPKGVGVAGWAVKNREPKLVHDTLREPVFSPQVDELTGLRTTSLICVPLMEGSRPLGALEVVNTRTGGPFNESDRDILVLVGRLASMAIVEAEKVSAQAGGAGS